MDMATEIDDGGGGNRRRADGQEGRYEEAPTKAILVDSISVLPDDSRRDILTHLPLKDAIRMGAVARGWHDLWKTRWSPRSSMEIHLCSRDALGQLEELEHEPLPRRRLNRFSLIIDAGNVTSSQLRRFMAYAANCRVEDLHVEIWNTSAVRRVRFHLALASPLLARLSLHSIRVSNMYYKVTQPFRALEIILLHSVIISKAAFVKIIARCPSLRTLDLRYCDCLFFCGQGVVWPATLRSVTIMYCTGTAYLGSKRMPNLQSFRYSGNFPDASFFLPDEASLSDLYLCFDNLVSRNYSESFNEALTNNLSGITVLTICSNALQVASSFWFSRGCQSPKLSNLLSLRELQLIMSRMEDDDLA